MADNIVYSGTGASVPANTIQRTDDLGAAGVVPYVKLLDGTDGGTTAVPGGANGLQTQGQVAHDAANAGNPVVQGAEAIAHGTNPTAVAAGDSTKVYANRAGIPFVIGGHPNIQTIEYLWTTAQTDEIILVSSGAKIAVTRISVVLDESTTVGVGFRIGFGASTLPTLPTDGNTAAGILLSHPGMVPGGGITVGDGSGILGIGADNEDLRITTEVATGGAGRAYISYYTIES